MKKTIRIIAVILVLVLALSGCKKNTDSSVSPDAVTGSVTNGSDGSSSSSGKTDTAPAGSTSTPGRDSTASTPAATAAPAAGDHASGTDAPLSPSDLTGRSSDEAVSSPVSDFFAGFESKSLAKEAADDASGSSFDGGFYGELPLAGDSSWDMAPEGLADGAMFSGSETEGIEFGTSDYVPDIYRPTPKAGLLTAGEWNDNKNYAFLKALIANGQDDDFGRYFRDWSLTPFGRLVIHAACEDGSAMANAVVKVFSADGSLRWTCRTDNAGMAYVYYNVLGDSGAPASLKVNYGGNEFDYMITSADLDDNAVIELSFGSFNPVPKALDLMFMIDTTGSMWDELEYLQAELEDVINRVKNANPNLSLRLSVNFYRDLEDTYIVRSYPFSANIDEELKALKAEYADGGGDYEEAVELALDDAVNKHEWSEDAVKLMFLVLDAPPHNRQDVRDSLASTLEAAVEKGIRVIPVASSGVDKTTEFLLRTFAMVTGGTYTFLTDDSGIGGSHITPTIGEYVVEQLCDLLVRLIDEYLTGVASAPVKAEIPERPTQAPIEPWYPIDPIDPVDPIDPIDPIEPWVPEHSNSTVIISTVEGTTREMIEAICAKYSDYGLSIMYEYDSINAFALKTEVELPDSELFALIDALNLEECITDASLDYIYRLDDPVPDVPKTETE